MKKIKALILGLSLFSVGMNAQHIHEHGRNCSAMEVLERQLAEDPSMIQRMADIEKHTQRFEANPTANKAVITIPVVVHVVYRNTTENVSDAQIQSQIDVMNKDFRKLNSDITKVPSAFSGLAADSEVQFCLAKRTPTGTATTGINRVSSTRNTDWGTNDAVKKTSSGGVAPWDATKYLNIWVCSIGGGILGYAQFPGGSTATDGVVIDYRYFGTTGTATAPFNLGRTATHEVGHWLNLRHIWGDASCGSDLVNDTPTQQTSNYGCPSFPHVTCSNGTNGDMFMNYMDYTDDACMYMFSAGQKTRMQALFATGGSRVGLVTSNGCVAPTGGTTCAAPSGLASSSVTASSATVSWAAASGASSYSLQYKLSTASTWTTVTTTSTSYSLSGLTASSVYNYKVATVCSGTTSAYSTASSFTTSASGGTTCTDAYESNNTSGTAKTIATNTNLTALINTSTDKDYFKFTTTSAATRVKIDVTNLPADYDVKLYYLSGSSLVSVATGQNTGTTSESIKYNSTSARTYYVYVYGYNGAYSASSCYTLRASTSSTNFRLDGSGVEVDEWEVNANDALNVYPNPTNGVTTLDITTENEVDAKIAVLDMMGRVCMTRNQIIGKGNNKVEMDLSELVQGIYIMRVDNGAEVLTKKVVVSK